MNARHVRNHVVTCLVLILLSWAIPRKLTAAEVRLRLEVSGEILPEPQWQDAAGIPIRQLDFKFKRFANGSAAPADVDSQVSKAKLVNTISDPQTVYLERPSECRIGSVRVRDRHVHFVMDRIVYSDDAKMEIKRDILHSFVLRFSRAGGYGGATGAVVCDNSGRVHFEY